MNRNYSTIIEASLSLFRQGGFFCQVFFVKRFNHKDLLGMGQLSVEDIELVMETAESFKEG